MAFRTLATSGKALLLNTKGAKVEGYLTDARTKIGKFKSTIYTLQTKNGVVKVWGNNTIDSALLDEKGKRINPTLDHCLVRLTCTEVRRERSGKKKKTYRDHKVEADTANKQKNLRGKVPF